MDPSELPSLTEEQKQALQQEIFISETLKIRSGKEDKKRRWTTTLFETAGGTALITVLFGGALGTILNSCIQANLKDREVRQAFEKAKGELALTQYQDYLAHRQDAMKSTYDLVGRCASACYTLALRMTRENNPNLSPKGKQRDEVTSQNDETQKKFLAVEGDWRSNRDRVGLLVSYYYEGNDGVMKCWNETKESVNKYLDATSNEYRTYISGSYEPREPTEVAQEQRADYEKKIATFTQCIAQAEERLWKEYFPRQTANANK